MFDNTLMHKTHRTSGSVLSPAYANHRNKRQSLYFRFLILSAILELPIMGGDVKGRNSLVGHVFTYSNIT
jgi:hypothetical protein